MNAQGLEEEAWWDIKFRLRAKSTAVVNFCRFGGRTLKEKQSIDPKFSTICQKTVGKRSWSSAENYCLIDHREGMFMSTCCTTVDMHVTAVSESDRSTDAQLRTRLLWFPASLALL